MNANKWLWRTLAVLLSLVILAGVGFAGFRMGVMQGANLPADGTTFILNHGRGFDGDMVKSKSDFGAHGRNDGRSNFDRRGDFDRRSGFSPFGFVFGLVKLTVFAGLVWLGYRFVKNSGWKLVKAEVALETPPPAKSNKKKNQA